MSTNVVIERPQLAFVALNLPAPLPSFTMVLTSSLQS